VSENRLYAYRISGAQHLGPNEVRELFRTLAALRSKGRAIVVITHKLSEAIEIADRVTVLREGEVKAVASRGHFDEGSLARAMIGRELVSGGTRHRRSGVDGEPTLVVEGLAVSADNRRRAVDGVSFSVHAGEIVGVAGVEGNGQSELAQALAGLRRPSAGAIRVGGVDISRAGPRQAHAQGLSVISEDRQQWDIVPDMTLAENLALGAVASGRYSRWGLLSRQRIRTAARRLLADFDVRPGDPSLPAGKLSGGNQQKLVLARELSRRPRVLVAAQPTRGLDIKATEFVHDQLRRLRDGGTAIVLISLDLDELLGLADVVMVLYRGRIVYRCPASEVRIEDVAAAMAGVTAEWQRVSREAVGG
jgi:ABC-type uncharacterized transport system ATPase subunit